MDIRVLGFKTKLNVAGKPTDWVEYAPAHAIGNSTNVARVNDIIPPAEFGDERDPRGIKMSHMKALWAQIEPHYEAWKKGADMPESGTPLSAWPGVREEEVFELNKAGLKSVEDVAAMAESSLEKVRLPNAREIRRQANLFLEARDGQEAAQTISDLQERLAASEALIAEMMEKPAPKKRGRPPKAKDSEAA